MRPSNKRYLKSLKGRLAKARAQKKYNDERCTAYTFRLNNEREADVIAKMNSVPNKRQYVIELVRKDLNS